MRTSIINYKLKIYLNENEEQEWTIKIQYSLERFISIKHDYTINGGKTPTLKGSSNFRCHTQFLAFNNSHLTGCLFWKCESAERSLSTHFWVLTEKNCSFIFCQWKSIFKNHGAIYAVYWMLRVNFQSCSLVFNGSINFVSMSSEINIY